MENQGKIEYPMNSNNIQPQQSQNNKYEKEEEMVSNFCCGLIGGCVGEGLMRLLCMCISDGD